MSRLLVGLTGGLASGKSTVAGLLRDRGFLVIDADRLVADLYGSGEPGAAAVADLLGESALGADGSVDHAEVARRVFSDPGMRRRLEAAIHPLVRARFASLAAAADGVVVLEATLLAEGGLTADFDVVVTVEAASETQLARAIARGLDEAQARARLAAQGDGALRRSRSHRVLTNDGTMDDLRAAVAALVSDLEKALAAKEHSAGRAATVDHPVHELIRGRWSPRAFGRQSVTMAELASLFEAARWAPSAFNEQPWTFFVARREQADAFATLLDCLVPGNQGWAREAAALVLTVAKNAYDRNGRPNRHAWHDVGLAVAQLTCEATARGLVIHQMAGIQPDEARRLLAIPEGHQPVTAMALGRPGAPEALPDNLRAAESAPRTRRALEDFVFTETWGRAADWGASSASD